MKTKIVGTLILSMAACSAAMAGGVQSPTTGQPEVSVLASSLGVDSARLQVSPATSGDLKAYAPQNQPGDSPYSKAYAAVLKESAKGGGLMRFIHRGAPYVEGFAVVRDGLVVVRLTTMIS